MNEKRRYELSSALDKISETLIKEYQPEKIILFGSMVDQDVKEWSDLDIAIIKQTTKPFYQRLREVALLCRPTIGVDFLVYTPEEFQQFLADQNPFITEEIVNKGKVIYERQLAKAVA